MKVKLLKTLKNLQGDVMRKGSIVYAEKRHRGFELTKRRRRKNGTVISITRVKSESFIEIK